VQRLNNANVFAQSDTMGEITQKTVLFYATFLNVAFCFIKVEFL